jgi:hypothetical protein
MAKATRKATSDARTPEKKTTTRRTTKKKEADAQILYGDNVRETVEMKEADAPPVVIVEKDRSNFLSKASLPILVLGIGFLIVIFFLQKCNSDKVADNKEKVEVEKAFIDSLKADNEINKAKAAAADSFARAETEQAAIEEAKRKVLEEAYFNGSRKQFEETLSNINKRSNEKRKTFQDADIRQLDSILDRIQRTGRYKNID